MYSILLEAHSGIRWFVVLLLLGSLASSSYALMSSGAYTQRDAWLRSGLTTVSHIQLLLGISLYIVSPVTAVFRRDGIAGTFEASFFGLIHPLAMMTGVVILTLAGSFSKRAVDDRAKHRTNLQYLLLAAVLILVAIPWPGSPLASRPLER